MEKYGLTGIILFVIGMIMFLWGYTKQSNAVRRPGMVTLNMARPVTEEVMKPGEKLKWIEKGLVLAVRADLVQIIEYNDDVGKTRVFVQHVEGNKYEVWYVNETLQQVQAAVRRALG